MFICATMVPSRFADKGHVSGRGRGAHRWFCRSVVSLILRSCTHLQRVCVVVEVLTAVVLWTLLPISGVRQWLSTSSPEQTHG